MDKDRLLLLMVMTIVISSLFVIVYAEDSDAEIQVEESKMPVSGFVDGIGDFFSGIGEAISNFFSGIADFFHNLFGGGSPDDGNEVSVGDIKYEIKENNSQSSIVDFGIEKYAAVIGYEEDSSSWDIPPEINVDGVMYPVVSVNKNAFSGSKAKSIIIGSSVRELGKDAFSNLSFLEDVKITGDITKGENSFAKSGISNGIKIEISEGVVSLAKNIFKDANIQSVSLPSSLSHVTESTFSMYVPEGKVLLGWYSDVDDLTSKFNFDDAGSDKIILLPIIADSSKEYRQESITYIVQYKYNEDFMPMSYEVVNVHEVPKLPSVIEKEGYLFGGWFVDNSYTEKHNVNLPISKDLTLYGKYVKIEDKSKVLIQVKGGINNPNISNFEYSVGDKIRYKDEFFQTVLNSVGTREGFSFSGLYDGETLWYDEKLSNEKKLSWSQTIIEDMILEVRWESDLYEEYDPSYVGYYNGGMEPGYIGAYSNDTYDYYTYYVGTAIDTILKHGDVYRNDGTVYIQAEENGTELGETISTTYTNGSKTGHSKSTIEQNGGVDGWGIASGTLGAAGAFMSLFKGIPVIGTAFSVASGICGIVGSIANKDSGQTTTETTEFKERWEEYTTGESTSRVESTNIIKGTMIEANVGVEAGNYVTYAVLGSIDYYQIEVYDKSGNYVGTMIEAIPTTNDYDLHGITVPDKDKSSGANLERSFFVSEPISYEKIIRDFNEHPDLRFVIIKPSPEVPEDDESEKPIIDSINFSANLLCEGTNCGKIDFELTGIVANYDGKECIIGNATFYGKTIADFWAVKNIALANSSNEMLFGGTLGWSRHDNWRDSGIAGWAGTNNGFTDYMEYIVEDPGKSYCGKSDYVRITVTGICVATGNDASDDGPQVEKIAYDIKLECNERYPTKSMKMTMYGIRVMDSDGNHFLFGSSTGVMSGDERVNDLNCLYVKNVNSLKSFGGVIHWKGSDDDNNESGVGSWNKNWDLNYRTGYMLEDPGKDIPLNESTRISITNVFVQIPKEDLSSTILQMYDSTIYASLYTESTRINDNIKLGIKGIVAYNGDQQCVYGSAFYTGKLGGNRFNDVATVKLLDVSEQILSAGTLQWYGTNKDNNESGISIWNGNKGTEIHFKSEDPGKDFPGNEGTEISMTGLLIQI